MNPTKRHRRHQKSRQRLVGSAKRPRVSIHRSARYVRAQLIDDEKSQTVVALSSKGLAGKTKTEQAQALGEQLAKAASAKKINHVVFDRSGYRYHGRVKAVAEGLRSGGLKL